MKKTILFSLLLTLMTSLSFAQDGAKISVDKDLHNYGTMKQGADGDCFFVIKNEGNQDLLITDAKGSCGCTVPEYSKDPIKPGKTMKMKVHYDTNRIGDFSKSVTITSNAIDTPVKVVQIRGVVEAPAQPPVQESTPQNGTIQTAPSNN